MNEKDNALAIIQGDAAIETAKRRQNEVLAIKQAVFQPGVHFGPPYPGAKNDTLLKPGATFLQQKYGLRALHERMETTIHVDTSDLSKSYIIIQDRCRIVLADTGAELAQADAACSTFEDKYLFRNAQRVCPTCGQATIFKSNDDKRPGFYCWAKKGGCGARFAANDTAIIGQETGKSANENPLNLLDTIVAMAQKRAEVRATIKATGVDALFSPGDGVTVEYLDVDEPPIVQTTVRKVDVVTGEIVEDAPLAEAPATPKAANVTHLDDTSATMTVSSVRIKVDKNKKAYLLFYDGTTYASLRGRELLRGAGYADCDAWEMTDGKDYKLWPPALLTIQKDGKFWNVTGIDAVEDLAPTGTDIPF